MPATPNFLLRCLQFRLRTLLLVVFGVAVWLAWQRYHRPLEMPTPIDWDVGKYPSPWGARSPAVGVPPKSRNIKWSAPLGTVFHSSPVVSGGKVFIGANNQHGYLARFPSDIDLGVLLGLDAETGKFLWQASSTKLPTGRAEDWPGSGVTSTPLVERDRLWYVNNRAEVVCLDTQSFYDDENDGVVQDETPGEQEADVVWSVDMRQRFGVVAHEMSFASPAADRDRLFVVTGNGVDSSHMKIPSPQAPSFIALDKQTGKVLWTDDSPGLNIQHAQWGSPTYAVLAGVPQVIFPGGDGWLYSFDPAGTPQGKSKLLWKFDLNPKSAVFRLAGRGNKNEFAYHITVASDRVYAAAGQDVEHGTGPSILWCIDPSRRGDVSEEIVYNRARPGEPVPPTRLRAMDAAAGDLAAPNPNSAVVWKYESFDANGDGKIDPLMEQMHRIRGAIVVKDNVLLAADFEGIVHCLDADTGAVRWTYDMLAACWNSPLINGNYAYVGDEDGDIAIFQLLADANGTPPPTIPIAEINMQQSTYSVPAAANGVLYVATKFRLFAIEVPKKE